jgi:hypothetical protein
MDQPTYLSQQCPRQYVDEGASEDNLGRMRLCDPQHLLVVRLRSIDLFSHNFNGHVYFIEDLERTSDNSCDTVLDGHDIGRTALEHGHI